MNIRNYICIFLVSLLFSKEGFSQQAECSLPLKRFGIPSENCYSLNDSFVSYVFSDTSKIKFASSFFRPLYALCYKSGQLTQVAEWYNDTGFAVTLGDSVTGPDALLSLKDRLSIINTKQQDSSLLLSKYIVIVYWDARKTKATKLFLSSVKKHYGKTARYIFINNEQVLNTQTKK